MGIISEFKRKVFSGAEADMVNVPSPAVGDRYNTTDTNRSFFYTGAAWVHGLLDKMIDHTWEGDDANNREIDLGGDYDFILIFLEENQASNTNHLCLAYSFRTVYGIFLEDVTKEVEQHSGPSGDGLWQGKMSGGDADKIKLGSSGNNAKGTNFLNWTYRLIGFKFQDMV